MGRRAQPKDRIIVRYHAGPPKRITVTLVPVGREPRAVALSTADARSFAAFLFDAIDTAEADKLKLRATDAPKRKPKRTRPRANGGVAKAPPRPSRLKRIEQAALSLSAIADRARLPAEAREALAAIDEALGVSIKGFSR